LFDFVFEQTDRIASSGQNIADTNQQNGTNPAYIQSGNVYSNTAEVFEGRNIK
jgi:hypothetical protein